MLQAATLIDQTLTYQNDILASQLAEQLRTSRPRKEVSPIPTRLRKLKQFFQAAYNHFEGAVKTQATVSNAAEWLLDNFYVDAEVSADGHSWSMGAYATDYTEKTWPTNYSRRGRTYDYEGSKKIARPTKGYIWDHCKAAGVSYRSYGEFVRNGKTTNDPGTTRVATLKGHFDPWFRSFDMDYPDQLRADRFISELRRFEQLGGRIRYKADVVEILVRHRRK